MSLTLGGINAGYTMTTQTSGAQSGESARPTFAHNHTWGSIGEMSDAWSKYTKEWASYYSDAFAGTGAEGNGKITQEELNELLQAEFAGMGVNFTDSKVDETKPKAGTFEVYIDQKTRQKMADDPEYRSKVMAVIQSEMAGTGGYSVKSGDNVINDRTTGLSMNMIEGGPIYEGVPHSAGGTSAGGGVLVTSTSGSGSTKKSLLELIQENLEKRMEEEKEAAKKEEAKKAREDRLEISVEARAKIAALAVEKADEAEPADPTEPEALGSGLNVLA